METSVITADWEANTTLPDNSSQQFSFTPLAISSVFFDTTLSAVGLSLTIRHMWLLLHAETIDILQLNLGVFYIMNSIGLFIDLVITIVLPQCLLYTRVAFLGFLLTCGPLILCCICVERFVAVVYPTRYQQFKAKRFREFGCAAVWALTVAFPYGWKKNICLTFKFIASIFLLSILAIIFVNSRILQALKKTGPGRDTIHPMKMKAFNTVRLISLLTLVFYIPAAVTIAVLATCQTFQERLTILIPLCVTLCSLASIAHPFFRLFVQQHLRSSTNVVRK